MLDESNRILSMHRLSNAKEDYLSASDLLENGHCKAANNRAYYSMFHAIRAVFALEGVDFKKHSAVISYFNQHYIKKGIFDIYTFTLINDASMIRNESDYSDFFIASKDESETQVRRAIEFYSIVDHYIQGVLGGV